MYCRVVRIVFWNRTQHCIWGKGAGQRYKTKPGRLKLSIDQGGLCLRRRFGNVLHLLALGVTLASQYPIQVDASHPPKQIMGRSVAICDLPKLSFGGPLIR